MTEEVSGTWSPWKEVPRQLGAQLSGPGLPNYSHTTGAPEVPPSPKRGPSSVLETTLFLLAYSRRTFWELNPGRAVFKGNQAFPNEKTGTDFTWKPSLFRHSETIDIFSLELPEHSFIHSLIHSFLQ